jgi:class III poly(R)-hydroxyalkanoic acid synthase PhaE subunit
MSWNEPPDPMFKVMTEAQKNIWESWLDLLRNVPASSRLVGPLTPFGSLAAQGFKNWTEEVGHVAQDVAERLATSQHVVMRLLELSINAWKAILPKLESGENWQASLSKYGEQVRQQFLQFPHGMTQATQDTAELWRLYLEEWQKLVQPWADSLQRAPWHFGQAAVGNGSALLEMTNLYWDAYERTFGRCLESPSLGHTRELSQDLIRGFHVWVDSRRASFEYQILLAEAWGRAFEQYVRQLVSLAEKGEPVQSLRQLLYVWIDVIEDVFTGLFRSEEYLQRQAQLVNTVTAYRLIERHLVEAFSKTSHLPTRSEVDEAYKRIYELRREVRELKKTLHEIKAQSSPAVTRPTSKTQNES